MAFEKSGFYQMIMICPNSIMGLKEKNGTNICWISGPDIICLWSEVSEYFICSVWYNIISDMKIHWNIKISDK